MHNIFWPTFPYTGTRVEVSCLTVSVRENKKIKKGGGGFLKVSYIKHPWSMTLTVTKAKICQAHICILLLTLTSFVPHFFSLSLSQIIALEEDEPKLFTKTIQPGKKKKKNCSQRLIKTIFLARQKAYQNIHKKKHIKRSRVQLIWHKLTNLFFKIFY